MPHVEEEEVVKHGKLKRASLADHGNCAFLDKAGWSTARCRICDKLALVPNHVVLGSMLIGFMSGGLTVLLVETLWEWL